MVERAGACRICAKPCIRHRHSRLPNKTCSKACAKKLASLVTRARWRNKDLGMTYSQADRYLELLEMAEYGTRYDRDALRKQAEDFRDSATRSRYIG